MADKTKASYWQGLIKNARNDKKYKRLISLGARIVARSENIKQKNNSNNPTNICEAGGTEIEDSYNLIYEVTKTILPFLVSYLPQLIVDRENKDNDDVGRVASEILERAANKNVEQTDYEDVIRRCRRDAWLVGWGIKWLTYDIKSHTEETEYVSEDQTIGKTSQVVLDSETLSYEYIHPDDFICNVCRNTSELEWVGRRIYMSEDKFKKQFPDKNAADYSFSETVKMDGEAIQEGIKEKCEIWEIWDKETRKIYFYAPTSKIGSTEDNLVGVKDYPWEIDFPCTILVLDENNQSIFPTSPVAQVWTIQCQIDKISQRISKMVDIVKVKVAYDKQIGEMQSFLSENNDNKAVGVDLTKYGEKGIQGALWFMPLGEVINAITTLKTQRDDLILSAKKQICVSPILEGVTDSKEAFGTNRIKGAFGTLPVQEYQKRVVKFIEYGQKKLCDCLAQEFEASSILELANAQYMPEADDLKMKAVLLIKEERLRKARLCIDIESTKSYYDENYNQTMSQFYSSLLADIASAANIVATAPRMIGVLKSIIMAKVRGQRAGRIFEADLDREFEAQVEEAKKAAEQPPAPPAPTPDKQVDVQGRIEIENIKQKGETERKIMTEQRESAADAQRAETDTAKVVLERAKVALASRELDAEIIANQARITMGATPDTNLG